MRDLESFNAPISTHASSFLFVRSRSPGAFGIPRSRGVEAGRGRVDALTARARARHSSPRIEPRARGSETKRRRRSCGRVCPRGGEDTAREEATARTRARARATTARGEGEASAPWGKARPSRACGSTRRARGEEEAGVACLNEMFTLLTCYKTNNFEEGKCAAGRALDSSLELRAKAPKKMNTINHHLNRLIRLTKK